MAKLLDCPYTNRLIESFQSNEVKFAFVNYTETENEYQILMPFVKCREYFNELLMMNFHPKEFKFDMVHGFKYDPTYKLNLDEVLLAVRFPSKERATNFLDNLSYLHQIEESNKLDQQTTVEKVAGSTNTYLIKASKLWLQKCVLFNLYTLLIKLMCLNYPKTNIQDIHSKDPYQTISEIEYVKSISEQALHKLLANLQAIVREPSKYMDGSNTLRECYTVHAYSGIIYLLKSNILTATENFQKFLREICYPQQQVSA